MSKGVPTYAAVMLTWGAGAQAFRLTIDDGFEVEFMDLGGLRKRPIDYPAAINKYGEVTDNCRGPYYYDRAYFCSDEGGIKDFRNLFNSRYSLSNATNINSSGHIVGQARQAHDWTDPEGEPFLYIKQLGMVGLAPRRTTQVDLTVQRGWNRRISNKEY